MTPWMAIAMLLFFVLCVVVLAMWADLNKLRHRVKYDEGRLRALEEHLEGSYYTKEVVTRMVAGSPIDRPQSPMHDEKLEQELKNGDAGHPPLPVVEQLTGEPLGVSAEMKG